MPLTISDELLTAMGMTEHQARVEIACWLFDTDRVSKFAASRFAGLDRGGFEDELRARGMAVIHYTDEMWEEDLRALEQMRGAKAERPAADVRP